MATNYTGMKQILAKFWEKEQAKNDATYASKSDVTTLMGEESVSGSILNSIKTKAKDADYADGKTISQAISALEEFSTEDNIKSIAPTASISYGDSSKTIAEAISALKGEVEAKTGFKYEKVDELPTASEDTMQKIYLVPKGGESTGFKEWLVVSTGAGNYVWEEIGDTDVKLDEYATKEYVTNNAKDAVYSGDITIGDSIDDLDTRVSAMEAAEINIKINDVDFEVSKTDSNVGAVATINATQIKMSNEDSAQTIAEAIAAAGQIDDIKVKLSADSEPVSIVSGKVATLDLSNVSSLSEDDFNDIFSDGE